MNWCIGQDFQTVIFWVVTPCSDVVGYYLTAKRHTGHDADLPPSPNAEVKNAWISAFTPPYVFMEWCLVRHRDKFTL